MAQPIERFGQRRVDELSQGDRVYGRAFPLQRPRHRLTS
jgi:hypothetical protein